VNKKLRFTLIAGGLVLGGFVIGRFTTGSTERVAADSAVNDPSVWTCSMHPQIKLPESGQCPICFMDLIPLFQTDGDGEEPGQLSMSESAKKLAGISTAPVLRRGVHTELQLAGKIALDETRVDIVSARVPGRIDRLYVDYTGIKVDRGDHLAKLYSPELISLQKELIVARRGLQAQGAGAQGRHYQQLYDAARQKLLLLGFSRYDLTRIETQDEPRDHMIIRSEQKGVVVRKMVNSGSYVQEGSPLFHVADLSKVWVMLDAFETDLPWIRLGQKVLFEVDAWPGEQFEASVSFIDPILNEKTRTIRVRVIADNPQGKLKPGMLATASIKAALSPADSLGKELQGKWISPMHPQIVKDHPGTCDICGMKLVPASEFGYQTRTLTDSAPLVVPKTAILYTGKRSLVYVEVPGQNRPTYAPREVLLGPVVGEYIVVREGVLEGERVVDQGAFKIDGELQIRAKPSMINGGVAPLKPERTPKMRIDSLLSRLQTSPDTAAPEPLELSSAQDSLLGQLFAHYFELHQALYSDSLARSVKLVGSIHNLIHDQQSLLDPGGELYGYLASADSALKQFKTYTTLEQIRQMFEHLSEVIITLQSRWNQSDQPAYIAYCPMAFDDRGAYWLQSSKDVLNPYFGDMMLYCGEIRKRYE